MKNLAAKVLLLASVALSGCGGGGEDPVTGPSISGAENPNATVSIYQNGALGSGMQLSPGKIHHGWQQKAKL
ncbi:hypothetical protein CS022_06650 [Veronia nyctiphanis]|uniref:Uncharacterized protein n=1 Tax=Veronia nyctiphanis TaxID=1278244 RepID=A0A4Q0YUU6_9GAMM|nr:hypothetical protein [Veronia nyctiphanis]RXJ73954.1 hypothetical protein CS022_06650 [Veronia nyctiphanis]